MTKDTTPSHRREAFTRSGNGATIDPGTPAKAKPAPTPTPAPTSGSDPE